MLECISLPPHLLSSPCPSRPHGRHRHRQQQQQQLTVVAHDIASPAQPTIPQSYVNQTTTRPFSVKQLRRFLALLHHLLPILKTAGRAVQDRAGKAVPEGTGQQERREVGARTYWGPGLSTDCFIALLISSISVYAGLWRDCRSREVDFRSHIRRVEEEIVVHESIGNSGTPSLRSFDLIFDKWTARSSL